MTAREAFLAEYAAILEDTPAMTLSTMYMAFCRGYNTSNLDAERYRFAMDESIQDACVRPLGLAIAMLDKEQNEVGNFNITRWAVTYGEDADHLIDEAMVAWRKRVEEKNNES